MSDRPRLGRPREKEELMTDYVNVRDLLRRYQEAIDRKDSEAAVACFADDVIAYDLAPPLVQNSHAVRDPEQLRLWFNTWRGPLQSSEREADFRVAGDL